MRVYNTIEAFSESGKEPLVLTLGNFDGVHKGHQKILERCREKAGELNAKAAVFTFRNHPQGIIHPKTHPQLITGPQHKFELLRQQGIDVCFSVPFSRAFSEITAEDFVEKILVKQLHVQHICLGYNARFGHNRRGNVEMMKHLAKQSGFGFDPIEGVMLEGDYISSSRIRADIEQGHLSKAAQCLGWPYGIFAKVIPGDQRGRIFGFPTANLDVIGLRMPPMGVYPVKIRKIKLSETRAKEPAFDFTFKDASPWYEGVLNYGTRPTFHPEAEAKTAECLILDFQGDLYGEMLEVRIYPQIRPERVFNSPEDLKEQISRDVVTARKCLSCVDK